VRDRLDRPGDEPPGGVDGDGPANDGVSIKVYPVTNPGGTQPGAQTEDDSTTNNLTTAALVPQTSGLGFAVGTDWTVPGVAVSSDLTVDAVNNTNTIASVSGYKNLTAGLAATANLDAAGTAASEWQYLWFEVRAVSSGVVPTILRVIR
jgi:hypothetical protein